MTVKFCSESLRRIGDQTWRRQGLIVIRGFHRIIGMIEARNMRIMGVYAKAHKLKDEGRTNHKSNGECVSQNRRKYQSVSYFILLFDFATSSAFLLQQWAQTLMEEEAPLDQRKASSYLFKHLSLHPCYLCLKSPKRLFWKWTLFQLYVSRCFY